MKNGFQFSHKLQSIDTNCLEPCVKDSRVALGFLVFCDELMVVPSIWKGEQMICVLFGQSCPNPTLIIRMNSLKD